jgi:hypothetical protein
MEVPNPEQTASVFSLAVYAFLDSIIMEAYRVPHLSHEKLPPLCDYDRSKRLTATAFPVCIDSLLPCLLVCVDVECNSILIPSVVLGRTDTSSGG